MISNNYIIQVSKDGTNWGTYYYATGSYTKAKAQEVAAKLAMIFKFVQIYKQTITLETL